MEKWTKNYRFGRFVGDKMLCEVTDPDQVFSVRSTICASHYGRDGVTTKIN